MSTIFRAGTLLAVFVVTGITAQSQVVVNGGFELTPGTNYIQTGDSITNTAPTAWIQYGDGFRVGTNNPPDSNNSGAAITAHSGGFSLKCFSPGGWAGGGARQVIPNISPGQQFVVSGYGLNWSGDPMTNLTGTANVLASINLEFDGPATNSLGGPASPQLSQSTPTDTWVSLVVTGTAPVGTVMLQIQALQYGFGAFTGAAFFDDISIVNLNAPIVTNIFHQTISGGSQVCWSTVTNASYQAQSSPDSNTWTGVGTLVAGDGSTNCIFDAVGQFNKRFYRVLELK